MLNFLTTHIVIIPIHRVVKEENQSQTSSNQNNTKSTKAVTFANVAKPKNNQVIIKYFKTSFLLSESFLFCRKINQANKASKDRAITQRSVLLSTITRKAHIPLVNHNNKIDHQTDIQTQLSHFSFIAKIFFHFSNLTSSESDFFLFTNEKIWNTIAIPKINTKTAPKKFIETAKLSGDNPNHQSVQPVNENINVKN